MIVTVLAIVALSSAAGGFLYRLRGGLLNDLLKWGQKTQASRAVWAIPTGAFMTFGWHLPLWAYAALPVSVFASMALIGNGDYLDLKRKQPLVDLVGLLRNLIAVAPVAYFAPLPCGIYLATGAVHAQIYRLSHYLTGESRLAEILVGAVSWATIATLWQLG